MAQMRDSILESVQLARGIGLNNAPFDEAVITAINTALNELTQLGIGPADGFVITSEDETWEDFMGNDPRIHMAKTFVNHRVWLMFDPPQSSTMIDAIEKTIREIEWRLTIAVPETV